MQLTTSWQLIATNSGALIQKHGQNPMSIAYHTSIPTDQDNFGISHNNSMVLPAVTGKNIYGRTVSGTANISVEVA